MKDSDQARAAVREASDAVRLVLARAGRRIRKLQAVNPLYRAAELAELARVLSDNLARLEFDAERAEVHERECYAVRHGLAAPRD